MGKNKKKTAQKSKSTPKHAPPLLVPLATDGSRHTEEEVSVEPVETLRKGSARSSLALPLATDSGRETGLPEDVAYITPGDSVTSKVESQDGSFSMGPATVAECQMDIQRLDEAVQKLIIRQDDAQTAAQMMLKQHMHALSSQITQQLHLLKAQFEAHDDDRSAAPSAIDDSAAKSAESTSDLGGAGAAKSAPTTAAFPGAAQSARETLFGSAAKNAESTSGLGGAGAAKSAPITSAFPGAAQSARETLFVHGSAASRATVGGRLDAGGTQPTPSIPGRHAAESAGRPSDNPHVGAFPSYEALFAKIRDQQAMIDQMKETQQTHNEAPAPAASPTPGLAEMQAQYERLRRTPGIAPEVPSPAGQTNAEQRFSNPLAEEKFKLFRCLNGWVSLLGGPPTADGPFAATSAIGSNLSALEMSDAAKARPPASFPSRAVTDKPGAPYQRIVFDPVNERVEVLQRPPGGMLFSDLMAEQLGIKKPTADADMDRVVRETLKLEASKGLNASPERVAATYRAIAELADLQRGLANALTQLEQKWPTTGADQRRVLQVMQDYNLTVRACVSTLYTAWALKGVTDDRRHELLQSFTPIFVRNGISLGSSDFKNRLLSADEYVNQTFTSPFLNFFSGVPRGLGGPPPPASS